MKKATILKKIEELESERESLFAQKAPIEERLLESYYELEKLYEARDKAILKRNRKEIDINLILTAEHQSMVMHREAEKQIQKLGLWRGGYYPTTGQACIKLVMNPTNLIQTYESVKFLLPHMKSWIKREGGKRFPDEYEGKKMFKIFEHTLSENGSYCFLILPDESCQVVLRYSSYRVKILESFDNILDRLKYVQKYLYYENGDEE